MSARSGLRCRIGTHRYLVDTEGVSWATVRPTRQGVDQSAGAGEASLSNEVVWRRVRDNWIGGAGQEYADLTDEEDPSSDIRFHTSRSVDPWTRRQLSLLKPRVPVRTRTGTTGLHRAYPLACTGGGGFWFVDQNKIGAMSGDGRDGTSSSLATAVTTSGTVLGASSAGTTLYFIDAGNVVKKAVLSGGVITTSTFGSSAADMLAVCGSRLIAASGAELFELAADGTKDSIYVHYTSTFRWRGAVLAPGGIYVWGDDSGTGQIFLLPVADATGALEAPVPAGVLPIGEKVVDVTVLVGVLVVGTNVGVRLLTLNGDGTLTTGPAVDEVGAVRGLATAGRFIYAATDVTPYIWRFDPSRFTETLLPAFAAEADHVHGLAGGIDAEPVSVLVTVTDATSTAPARPTVVVPSKGVLTMYADAYGGQQLVAPDGEIDLGWFTYGIGEELSLDSVTVEVDPVGDAESVHQVRVYVDTPSEDAVLEAASDFSADSTLLTAHSTADVRARRFRVRLELSGDVGDGTSPVVREVVLRAAPAPHLSDEMILPLYLTEEVVDEGGQRSGLNPWDEFEYLLSLRDSRERVVLELGSYTATVRVEDVGVRSGGLGGGNGLDGWSRDGQWMKGKWDVRLVTVED